MTAHPLIILGASARAAAFSALRAGFTPLAYDLFGDVDLRARCLTVALEPEEYPHGFERHLRESPESPWIYTGGLENRPSLIRRLAAIRPLWGINAPSLALLRSPFRLAERWRLAGIAHPRVTRGPAQEFPWLRKPRRGSGGSGIGRQDGGASPGFYFQEFIPGSSFAAIFCAIGAKVHLLGITRQLVGEPWLDAAPFRYCGSIGPVQIDATLRTRVEAVGTALTGDVQGLFGIDGIWHEGTPYPVEVNPRYTASIEVLEYASGLRALEWHRAAFTDGRVPELPNPTGVMGKAILFARSEFCFPADGPWIDSLRDHGTIEPPSHADIPAPGTKIRSGWPVLTVFACANDEEECERRLKTMVAEVRRWLP